MGRLDHHLATQARSELRVAATFDDVRIQIAGRTATGSSYTLPDGAGTIDLQGQVMFIRPDHFFTMAVIDPVVTVDANGDAIVNVEIDLDSDFPSATAASFPCPPAISHPSSGIGRVAHVRSE